MSYIPPIDVNKTINQNSVNYNAVKIRINNPQANIADNTKSPSEGNGIYNAVDIEVNNPMLETKKSHPYKKLYEYQNVETPLTADILPISMIDIPPMPVAYQTNNFINNRTLVKAELEIENKPNHKLDSGDIKEPKTNIDVPQPNVTTTEAEKESPSDLSFHGISFKANEPEHKIEIVPPVDIKPEVNVSEVVGNLSSSDFDVQARQMEEIARVSMEDSQKAVPYIVTEIFSELVNIVEKDTSALAAPTEKQMQLRKQIIINEIIKEQAKVNNKNPEEVELPYTISENDIKEASVLSPMEQAERNKEYSLYTMAVLTKVYTDEVQRHTGNVVPLTDLPGVSTMVNALRENSNSGVKIAAIDSLNYINRPEYKDELTSLFQLAANDSNPYVARNAALALENINQ